MTLAEIAEYAHVSKGTVDRVIHHRTGVSEKTRKLIESIIEEYGCETNPIAAQLKINKDFVIGVLLPPLEDGCGYYKALYKGLQRAAEDLKAFKIKLDFVFFDRTKPGEAYEKGKELLSHNLDAFITMPVVPQEFSDLIPLIGDIPYVFIDTPLGVTQPILTIAQNPYKGGYCAGRIMKMMRGSGTFACIRMFQSAYNLRERVRGFTDFFANDSGSRIIDTICSDFSNTGIYTFMEKLFQEHPDISGIFIPHTEVHLASMYLINQGLKNKVTVIGYDLMPKNREGLADGSIDCILGQRPEDQGFDAVYKLHQMCILHQEIPAQIDVPIDIYFKENII